MGAENYINYDLRGMTYEDWKNAPNLAGDIKMRHFWFKFHGLTCCKRCGIVRRGDGGNDRAECIGHVGVQPRQGPVQTHVDHPHAQKPGAEQCSK